MECNQCRGSLQHKCRHTDFTTDEFSSITLSPPPARPHLLGPVSSFLTSTPWKASSAVTDEFVNSTLLIRLWWISVGGNFPFVVFLKEKQLNGTSTASIMAQRHGVQSNKAKKKWEQFTRVAERLIKIEITKTAFLSPKIRTDGKKMCFIWSTSLCIDLKLFQPLFFVDNQPGFGARN